MTHPTQKQAALRMEGVRNASWLGSGVGSRKPLGSLTSDMRRTVVHCNRFILQARGDLRVEGVRDASWLGSSAAGGGDGELAACHECGALPHFSGVTCACRCAKQQQTRRRRDNTRTEPF